MLQPFETPLCLGTAATLYAAICLGIIETRVTWRFDCASLPARLRRRAMQGEPCATHGQAIRFNLWNAELLYLSAVTSLTHAVAEEHPYYHSLLSPLAHPVQDYRLSIFSLFQREENFELKFEFP